MQNPPAKAIAFMKQFHFVMPNAIYKVEGEGWDRTGDRMNATVWFEAKYKKRLMQDLSDM